MTLSENNYLPLVTVVTPSFNQGRFIEETIRSVLCQDYPHIEYLVIDGGSTDTTLDILRKYEDHLTWISEVDSGQSHAINKGFMRAKGEILCWLNSDDVFESGAIRNAVEYMTRNPHYMLIYGDGNFINEQGDFLSSFPYSCEFDLWQIIHASDFILQPTTFFRVEALRCVGYLDEKLHWCMDWDLWIRIGKRFPVGYFPCLLAKARIYAETKTSQGGFRRMVEIVRMLRKHTVKLLLPAYVLYGSGVLNEIQTKSLNTYRVLRHLLWPVRKLIRCYVNNAQGVYPDGWLGQKAVFMFGSGLPVQGIHISLDLPDDKKIIPNTVTLTVNGKRQEPQTINSSGGYELTIPYDSYEPNPTEVFLSFARALPRDPMLRRLVCRRQKIDFVAQT